MIKGNYLAVSRSVIKPGTLTGIRGKYSLRRASAKERKANTKNGQPTYTWSNRRKYAGELKGVNPWIGIEFDKDGNVTATWLDDVRMEK